MQAMSGALPQQQQPQQPGYIPPQGQYAPGQPQGPMQMGPVQGQPQGPGPMGVQQHQPGPNEQTLAELISFD
jgi:hypothetical protein